MVTSTYPGQLASEVVHAGHWRFTRETVVTDPLAAQFYELYELTFGPLRSRSVARQVLTKSEFYTQMSDPRVDKYIAWSDDGEPVGITTLTKHLESVPWISPEYFAAHYPDHWARHAVYYLGFTLARPSMRQHGFLEAIIEVGMAPLAAERAVMGYDVCAYNNTRSDSPNGSTIFSSAIRWFSWQPSTHRSTTR